MRLSDFKGEEAMELLANIMDSATEIMADPNIVKMATAVSNNKMPQLEFVSELLRSHSKSILRILALLNKKKVDEYQPNPIEITKAILELMDDKELVDLFRSQGQLKEDESSVSALENTAE